MSISSEIKSKLRAKQNEVSFEWLGDGKKVPNEFNKLRRGNVKRYYRGFRVNSVTVYEGSSVLIRIGSFAVEDNYEVAKIISCYQDDSNENPRRAKIQWYTAIDKMKKNHLKGLQKGLPALDGDLEVVKDMWGHEPDIDVETITGLCCLQEVSSFTEPDSVKRPSNAIGPLCVCRFLYNKKSPFLTPLENFNSQNRTPKKSLLKSLENSNFSNSKKLSSPKRSQDKENTSILRSSSKKEQPKTPVVSLVKLDSSVIASSTEKKSVKRKLLDIDNDSSSVFEDPKKSSKKLRQMTDSDKENVTPSKDRIRVLGNCRSLKDNEIGFLLSDDNEDFVVENKRSSRRRSVLKKSSKKYNDSDSDDDWNTNKSTPLSKRNRRSSGTDKMKSTSKLSSNRLLVSENLLSPSKTLIEEKSLKSTEKKTLSIESEDDEIFLEESLSSKRMSKKTEKMKSFTASKVIPSSFSSPSKSMKQEIGSKSTGKRASRRLSYVPEEKYIIRTPRAKSKKLLNFDSDDDFTSSPKVKKETPSKRGRKSKNATPLKIPLRNTPLKGKKLQDTPLKLKFEVAKQQLHVSAVPESLPCREDEFQQIFSFVEGKLLDSTGGCMYVSGVPGTGKTATIREVVRIIRQCVSNDYLQDFDFIDINAMKLTKPHQLWVQMWEQLTGQKATPDHACSLLEKRLTTTGPRQKCVLMLLDELDLLWTRKQDVMYNLFDWSGRVGSRFIVVTIANTMDLPERMMINRVSSRLGLTRMTFQPYTHQQLQEIISSRLQGIKAFDTDAIQLVARKVAMVSGDARKALDVCRRATELAESNPGVAIASPSKSPRKKVGNLVGTDHVWQAITEMFSSPLSMAITKCSQMEKYILDSILMEFKRIGIEEALMTRVLQHLEDICRMQGMDPPSSSETMFLVNGLSAQKIIFTEHSRMDLALRLRLNISVDDVSYALEEKKMYS